MQGTVKDSKPLPPTADCWRVLLQESSRRNRGSPPPMLLRFLQKPPVLSKPRGSVANRLLRVSLCMIVKNEEHNLPDCLASVVDLVDEAVIVDTGSTDRTRDIAKRFGALVFDFPWVDNFAMARNESLRHARGEWIFWLDADDRLDEDNRTRLRKLFADLKDENAAYVMKCLCLPEPGSATGTLVDHVRLFRNRSDVRWDYRVHEQILPAVRATQGEVRWTDVVVRHVGYTDPALRRRKLERAQLAAHRRDARAPARDRGRSAVAGDHQQG